MVWFTSFNFFFVCVAFVLLCFLLCWSFLIPLLFGLSGVFSFVSCWLSATPWVAAPVWNRSSTCGHLSWGYLVSASSVAEELHHMLVTCSHVLVLVCLFFWLKSCFPWLCLVLCCSVHESLFFCSAVIFLLCICFLHLVLNGWVLKQWLGKNVGHDTRSQSSPEF